jgi:peptidoglycan/LPS O-acetylase OafA/YrhL
MKSRLPTLYSLDHRDSTVLKALAITAIVLHNFFHFVSPARQNEFQFHPGAFHIFLQEASQPSHAVQAFFSFFGHLGVQVFIFLSAFGLAKSHWDDGTSWVQFMWGRIKKLYPTILLIVVPWACSAAFWMGPHRMIREVGPELVAVLLGVSTLLGFNLPPIGPWWFIPFIVQFYALWHLLRWIAKRFGWIGLLLLAAGCMLLAQLADPALARWSINLLTTPIGRMPAICFGIAAARYRVGISAPLAVAGLTAVVLGNMYPAAFVVSFPGVLLVSMWCYMQLRHTLRSSRLLVRIGECSMLIFLLNAIVRNQLVAYAASPGSQLFWGFLSAALSIAISSFISWLLQPARSPASLAADEVPVPATT